MPLVSIITAAYNSEEYIWGCYKSIRSQSIEDWEWLVTDDCSNDNTVGLLQDIASNDSRVKVFVNEKNSGAAISRNKSLDNASGKFIAFLDSDDHWLPTKLARQLEFMECGYDFSFTSFNVVEYGSENILGTVDSSLEKTEFGYQDFLKKEATFGCSTVMLRNVDGFSFRMPEIRTGQDYAFWLFIARSGVSAHLLRECLTNYVIRKDSISRNKFKKAVRQWNIYRKIEGLGLVDSVWYFLNYAKNAIFRR